MVRAPLVDAGRTIVAEGREEKVEVGGEAALKAEAQEDEDEYVEEQGDGEDAAFEGARGLVDVEDVYVGFGG